jgi:hypothetical protein
MFNFQLLDLPIPTIVFTLDETMQKEIYTYLEQLNEQERKTYRIAYQHLGTSFHIGRSNGFNEWKNKKV